MALVGGKGAQGPGSARIGSEGGRRWLCRAGRLNPYRANIIGLDPERFAAGCERIDSSARMVARRGQIKAGLRDPGRSALLIKANGKMAAPAFGAEVVGRQRRLSVAGSARGLSLCVASRGPTFNGVRRGKSDAGSLSGSPARISHAYQQVAARCLGVESGHETGRMAGVVLLPCCRQGRGKGALNPTRTRLVHRVRPHCWYATMAPAPACCRPGSEGTQNARTSRGHDPLSGGCPRDAAGARTQGQTPRASSARSGPFPGQRGALFWLNVLGLPQGSRLQGSVQLAYRNPHQAVLSAARAGRIGGGVSV